MLSAVLMREMFGIRELKPYQTEAKVQFLQKIDLLVNPPTGCSKSPIYQALPFVFDSILEAVGHVVVVVSPLVNRIRDQVEKLANVGIFATSLSDISEDARGVLARKWLKYNLQRKTA